MRSLSKYAVLIKFAEFYEIPNLIDFLLKDCDEFIHLKLKIPH